MDDKRHLVAKLVSPNKAGVGDYVFVLAGPGPSGLDIVRVTDVAPDGRLRVEGDERYYALRQIPTGVESAEGAVSGRHLPNCWGIHRDRALAKISGRKSDEARTSSAGRNCPSAALKSAAMKRDT